mmetsp:Transcript_2430/g.6871  ORF Transcript_2430/g.6871 Transcript_2430/m.6871 type:complete len:223 (-) Transcript_2430:116-784(-)
MRLPLTLLLLPLSPPRRRRVSRTAAGESPLAGGLPPPAARAALLRVWSPNSPGHRQPVSTTCERASSGRGSLSKSVKKRVWRCRRNWGRTVRPPFVLYFASTRGRACHVPLGGRPRSVWRLTPRSVALRRPHAPPQYTKTVCPAVLTGCGPFRYVIDCGEADGPVVPVGSREGAVRWLGPLPRCALANFCAQQEVFSILNAEGQRCDCLNPLPPALSPILRL